MTNLANDLFPPTVMVIFGASGDLTSRKLVPALFNLSVDKLLPERFFFNRLWSQISFGRRFSGKFKEILIFIL